MSRLHALKDMDNEELVQALSDIETLEKTGLWPKPGMPYWVELVGKALSMGTNINKASEEIFREAAYRFQALHKMAHGKLDSLNKSMV